MEGETMVRAVAGNQIPWLERVNAERERCGVFPLEVDGRLNAIAVVRLTRLAEREFAGMFRGETAQLVDLALRFGFHGRVWEGVTVGNCEMAGLAIYGRGDGVQRFDQVRKAHHQDLVDPLWESIGYAFGCLGVKGRKVKCSVTVYGCEFFPEPVDWRR